MKWYYAEGGRQVGPVEESVLDDLVRQGTVRDDTLVWREGMASWQKHAAARGGSSTGSGAPPPPPASVFAPAPASAGDTRYCSECGRPFPASQLTSYGDVSVCAQGLGLGRNPDPSQVFAALPAILSLAGLSFLIQMAVSLSYEVYFLSTRGATPGKMALGLKIIRADGSPVSAGLAAGRYFARILSWLTLLIGFIIAGFDREKRALHDHICGTRVVYTR